jgi:DNA-binding Lrp family transcriptional regulator
MELTPLDRQLVAAVVKGLPLVSRPYDQLAEQLGIPLDEVLERLKRLQAEGAISRFGVIVKHRPLGYSANAMVVWDVPEEDVRGLASRFCALPYVTLCYHRPRRPPAWPYNLFCMIHGRDRATVLQQVDELAKACGAEEYPRAVLFSGKAYKQRGARYRHLEKAYARPG